MEIIEKIKSELILNNNLLKIRVIPNAKKSQIDGIMDNGFIKVRLISIPEKGRANKELIDFLSKYLFIKKSKIEIVSGLTDRNKIVKIDF